jgi:hypothetical protein
MTARHSVSVIIPSRDGRAGGNVGRLREAIARQTVAPLEVIVPTGVSPNGRARNVAVRKARGDMLILIDDDITIGHDRVFESLLAPFSSRTDAGMTGTAVLMPPDQGWVGRRYGRARGVESPVVRALTDSDKVQHACLAIPTDLYKRVGWESDDLITGTDDDLRQRVRAAGYRLYVVPGTWVYHRMPDRFGQVLRKGFTSGLGSAYALRVHPALFGRPVVRPPGYRLKTDAGVLLYRALSTPVKVAALLAALRPVAAAHEAAVTAGFCAGWFRYTRARRRPR